MAEQLGKVVGNVEGQIEDLSDAGEKTAKKVLAKTRRATAQAFEVTSDGLAQGQELIKTGYERSLDIFRKYPIESAVACLGAGILVGKMLNSRN